MAIFGWFSKKEPEDYEQVLSSLALDVQKRQTRLSEIRLRERRTTLLTTLYAFAFWVAYVGVWYMGLLPHFSSHRRWSKVEEVLMIAPVFLGPILVLFTRRIVQTWYTRIGNAEEKQLKALLAKQRSKVEEIKKKTNYYTTKNLIDRYDSPTNSPLRQRPVAQQATGTPQRPAQPQPNGKPQGQFPDVPPPAPQGTLSTKQQNPATPPRKQWYDKLADAILGDDELSMRAASNQYALICRSCFAHNGLVKEELWQDTQYICPKCGQFNPSMRALKERRSLSPSASPTSPEFSSSQELRGQDQKNRLSRPRNSMPPSLLQATNSDGADRRRSMPAQTSIPFAEGELPERLRKEPSHSPLSNTFSLPEEEEAEDTGKGENVEVERRHEPERAMQMEIDS